MEDYKIIYDSARYHPKAETLEKLAKSMKDAAGLEEYEIRCPLCGFLNGYILGEKSGIFNLKCRKCKYKGPINLAYFRTQKPDSKHVKFEPWRYGMGKTD